MSIDSFNSKINTSVNKEENRNLKPRISEMES